MVVIVGESKNPNPDHVLAAARLGKYLYESKLPFRRADPDETVAGKTPAWLSPVLAKTSDLPVLAVVAKSPVGVYSVVAVEALPLGFEAGKQFLTKHGVKP